MASLVEESIGVAMDFTTPTLWEAAIPADITLATGTDEIYRGIIHDTNVYTDLDFLMGGTATAAGNYTELTINPGDSHSLVRGSGVVLKPTGSQAQDAIRLQNDFSRLFGLEIDCSAMTVNKSGLVSSGVGSGATHYIGNIMVYDNTAGAGGSTRGIDIFDNEITAYLFGCIAMNIHACGFGLRRNTLIEVYNSLAYKTALSTQQGFLHAIGTAPLLRNVVSLESGGNDIDSGMSASSTNNTASDTTTAGSNSIINANHIEEFRNTGDGSEDVHLRPGAGSVDTGASFGSLGITPEINFDPEGDERGGPGGDDPWDRGPDEFVNEFPLVTLNNKVGGQNRLQLKGGLQ